VNIYTQARLQHANQYQDTPPFVLCRGQLSKHKAALYVSRGRNSEGQTGIEESTIVTRPTPVLGIASDIVKLVAGRLNSGAVTASGARDFNGRMP